MNKKLAHFIFYWLPTVLFMIVIFYLSSKQRVSISQQDYINFIFFKTLHVIEYSLLYLLIFRSLNSLNIKAFTLKKKLVYAIIVSLLYAISDEIHQTFVPTREGTLRDVFIDILGIAIMYTLIKKYFPLINKYIP